MNRKVRWALVLPAGLIANSAAWFAMQVPIDLGLMLSGRSQGDVLGHLIGNTIGAGIAGWVAIWACFAVSPTHKKSASFLFLILVGVLAIIGGVIGVAGSDYWRVLRDLSGFTGAYISYRSIVRLRNNGETS